MHIRRDDKVCYTQVDTEIVILNPKDENLYHMNETAAELWLALETPKSLEELSKILAEKYAGIGDPYQADVLAWINDTQKKGLLIVE